MGWVGECRKSAVGGRGDGNEKRVGREDGLESFTLPCQACCQQRSSRLQVGHSSQAPLAIAGAPRTILDLTHRTLMHYCTRAGAHAQARTGILVRHEGRNVAWWNSRTEYDALRSAVI